MEIRGLQVARLQIGLQAPPTVLFDFGLYEFNLQTWSHGDKITENGVSVLL